MTADQVFTTLSSELQSNGIGATYSPLDRTLSLGNLVSPSNAVVFGDTDTGLSISALVAGVPEPSSLLVVSGATLLSLLGWHVVRPRVTPRI